MWWLLVITGVVAGSLPSTLAYNLPGVPVAFLENDEVLSALSDDIARKFADEYWAYVQTGVESAALRQIVAQLAASHSKEFLKADTEDLSAADQFFICTTCRATLNVLARAIRDPSGAVREELVKAIAVDVCTRLKIQPVPVCQSLIDIFTPTAVHIIENMVADARTMCGILPISFCKVQQPEYNWTVSIDANGPEVEGPKQPSTVPDAEQLKILHLTDIHFDPNYAPNTLAECEEYLCCQAGTSAGGNVSLAAGYWSDYRYCDAPWHMIVDAFDHINTQHGGQFDFIYDTGDLVQHNVWFTSKEGNMDTITKVHELLREKFPDTPIYSSVGNHEPHPVNNFGGVDMPDELSAKWLYQHLYKMWSKWLPTDTEDSIMQGGYYTVSPRPGFRIISLNNNDGYLYNFWIFQDGSTAIKQLQWFHDTLLAAEKAGEQVHVLAHVPSGDAECWNVWAREYNRIIARFSHIIGGIFNGHTHKDEMNVHYSSKGHAVAMAWNGGSLTSWVQTNPNYRLYRVETDTWQVIDHETWIFNVTEANVAGAEQRPRWFLEYEFAKEFTTDLSPAGIDALLERMTQDPELLEKFWRYKQTSADPRVLPGCDRKCLLNTICRLATSVFNEKERCMDLKEKLSKTLDSEGTTPKPDGGGGGAGTVVASHAMLASAFLMLFAKILF